MLNSDQHDEVTSIDGMDSAALSPLAFLGDEDPSNLWGLWSESHGEWDKEVYRMQVY